MRIISIKLKNINSLRGEHLIDFSSSPLKESGLFGIVGATGSGKSTLLDCITLALYGKVPRIGPVNKNVLEKTGAILTKHEKECYTQVTYSCKKGEFTARWSVAKTRNDTFRNAEMKVFSAAGELLNENLSSAADVNTENIGLDYDQFVKSILLCQGDFAKFLQSDKNKRAELLEKITGAREYRRIGKKAFHAYSTRKHKLDTLSEAISISKQGLLTDEEKGNLEERLNLDKKNVSDLTLQWEKAKSRLVQKQRLSKLRAELDEKNILLEKAKSELEVYNKQYGEILDHYEKLFPFREELAEHARISKRSEDLSLLIANLERDKKHYVDQINKLVDELRKLVNEEVSENDYFLHLDGLRDKIMDLEARKREQRHILKSCFDRFQPLLENGSFNEEKVLFSSKGTNGKLLTKLGIKLSANRDSYEKILKRFNIGAAELPELRQKLFNDHSELSLLLADVRSFSQQNQAIKLSTEKISHLNNAIGLTVSTLSNLEKNLAELEVELEKAEKEKLQAVNAERLEQLRASLQEGEPCPLCGSEHHPYVHQFAQNMVDKNDHYQKLKNAYQQLRDELNRARIKQGTEQNLLELENEALIKHQLELGSFRTVIEGRKLKLGIDKISSEDKVSELIKQNKDKLDQLETCIQLHSEQSDIERILFDLTDYDAAYEVLKKFDNDINAIYDGDDFESMYKQRKHHMQHCNEKRKLANEQSRSFLQEQQVVLEKSTELRDRLLKQLRPLGYSDLGDAKSHLISETEHKDLQNKQKNITGSLSQTGAVIEALVKQLDQEGFGDDPTIRLEEQANIVHTIGESITELNSKIEHTQALITSDDRKVKEIRQIEEEKFRLQAELRPWEMLNRLIGDANGNKFNTKAQELTLDHLLIFANKRMEKLHGRYKLLRPEENDDNDLRVADGYMGGEIRTVRSLSGGETFVLSLALALGLSDLASRDIRIDSLFVDEGFGSLDPDTLEEAMSTLEQLQTESNKTVGIISHVESLKERIYTQVRLEKSNNGFSTISIFPEPKISDEQAEKPAKA